MELVISLKAFAKRIFRYVRRTKEPDDFFQSSYSQEGEDILIGKLLSESNQNGFFVDIGAHHPKKFSNTFLLYQRGFRGINIDAMPGSMVPFNKERPEDINIECPISDKKEELTYYSFNYPEVNTFVEEHAKEWDGKGPVKLINKQVFLTSTINEILEKYFPKDQNFMLLSIDVEGMDFKVLKSINLNNYRPFLVLIEEGHKAMPEILEGEIFHYLTQNRYKLVSKLWNTTLYQSA